MRLFSRSIFGVGSLIPESDRNQIRANQEEIAENLEGVQKTQIALPEPILAHCEAVGKLKSGSETRTLTALGAVGRRFKSCRPEGFKYGTVIAFQDSSQKCLEYANFARVLIVYSLRSDLSCRRDNVT